MTQYEKQLDPAGGGALHGTSHLFGLGREFFLGRRNNQGMFPKELEKVFRTQMAVGRFGMDRLAKPPQQILNLCSALRQIDGQKIFGIE
jgi:ammonia channel protein AmtB